MNIGIIGYGKMGKTRHEVVEKLGHKVISIYDPSYEHSTKNYDEILQDKNISVIVISTPNYLTKEVTIESLKNGKHVFCEKPPAMNHKDMLEIKAEKEKHPDLKLMYGFNHRHHDSIIKIKEIIDNNKYGKVLWLRGRYGKNVDDDFFDSWRSRKKESGGGILLDQGIHMLDLFIYLVGEFNDLHAFVSNQFWKIDGIEDNVFAIFKNTEKNISASLHSTMMQWRHLFSLEITLERGYIVLNGLKTSSGAYGKEELVIADNINQNEHDIIKEEKYTYTINNSWINEMKHFFKCINKNEDVLIGNIKDAEIIMKTIDRIYNVDK